MRALICLLCLCLVSTAFAKAPTCKAKMKGFKKKKELNILVAFGYKDARPARYVGDRYERNVYVQQITSNCKGKRQACGFTRDEKDGNLFYKTIGEQKINLTILHSSVSEDDRDNRKLPHQNWLSENAYNRFIEGLTASDVVFYNGHSRNGGGPDFKPPILRKNKHVNYYYYKKSRSSFKGILNRIKGSSTPVGMLSFFSCKATKHFQSGLEKSNKEVLFLADNRLIYYWDAIRGSLTALDALLRGRCKSLTNIFK